MAKKKTLTPKQQAAINLNRRTRRVTGTISFLDHLCIKLLGRTAKLDPNSDDDYLLNETIAAADFVGALDQFVRSVKDGSIALEDVKIMGQDRMFYIKSKEQPGYQLYINTVMKRFETDAEVQARLAKRKKTG
jgi:hypothetical protein